MEPLSKTKWDVILTGTGLAQSLLALALSRSDKKILHVDRNDYYGGAEAALSLQEADDWVKGTVGSASSFRNASIAKLDQDEGNAQSQRSSTLGFSRAYSLALAPQLIYTRSTLLSTLVSSKTYRQLEFLAVGSWWIYDDSTTSQSDSPVPLKKIPAGREDVFADSSIDIKSKRALIKFVRLVVDPEAQAQAVEEHGEMSFGDYLTSRYGIPPHLQAALNALALSPHSPSQTKTSFALPRVNRHLTSFNVFGAGFNAVIPKWGGTAEVAQVACRAGAVGGSVYMLGKGIADVQEAVHGDDLRHLVSIADEDTLSTQYIVGRATDLPMLQDSPKEDTLVTRSVSIISSHLDKLFSSTHEGPAPACSVVVFPHISEDQSPVYVVVHTSETGECPKGQSVIYAQTACGSDNAFDVLERAVDLTLQLGTSGPQPSVLWKLQYQQKTPTELSYQGVETPGIGRDTIVLPEASVDLAFDDSILKVVRDAWQKLEGVSEGFMQFEDREIGAYDDDEDEQ